MSPFPTNCPHCGARLRSEGRTCEFCGGLLPAADANAAPVVLSLERRFVELESHPQYPELLRKRPSAKGRIAQGVVGTVFAGVFLVIAFIVLAGFGAFSWAAAQFTPFGALIIVIPLLAVGVGIYVFTRVAVKTGQLASAEMEVRPALIAGERTHVDGGSDGPGHTSYFVTLEARDGTRRELNASGSLVGRVTQGDIGVAYVKADHLIEFERVRV